MKKYFRICREVIFANQTAAMFKNAALFLFCSVILLSACRQGSRKSGTDNAFLKTLKDQSIGNSGYVIALPETFMVRQKGGADFKVYYFSPADSTAPFEYTAGMYMGNFPTEFPPTGDSCANSTVKEEILGKKAEWKVFSCDSSFFVQTILDNNHSEGWNSKIHAFGKGSTRDNLKKVFDIFTTLKHK